MSHGALKLSFLSYASVLSNVRFGHRDSFFRASCGAVPGCVSIQRRSATVMVYRYLSRPLGGLSSCE
jgi:hypothetical protein